MAKFVLNNRTEPSHQWFVHFFEAKSRIVVSDATNIFHGSIFIIRAHHVVDLAEWISLAKACLEDADGCFRNAKHKFVFQVIFY